MRYFVFAAFFMCLTGRAAADDGRAITIGFGPSMPNHFMVDDMPSGVLFAVGDAALRRAGFDPTYRELPWARLYDSVARGVIDGAIGVLATQERRREALYTTPIMSQYVVLAMRTADDRRVDALSDLSGWTIGGRFGLSYQALKGREDVILARSRTDENNVGKLLRGRLDAILIGSVSGRLSLRANGREKKIAVVAAVDKVQLGMALADERYDIRDLRALNAALGAAIAEGVLDDAARDYGVSDFIASPKLLR